MSEPHLNVGPEHEPGDLLAALPLDRHRGRGVRRGGRPGREEGRVVLGAVGQQVERLRLSSSRTELHTSFTT